MTQSWSTLGATSAINVPSLRRDFLDETPRRVVRQDFPGPMRMALSTLDVGKMAHDILKPEPTKGVIHTLSSPQTPTIHFRAVLNE